MKTDPKVILLILLIIAFQLLQHYVKTREKGRTKFDKYDDDKKYSKFVDAHLAGAIQFISAYMILLYAASCLSCI